MSTTLPTLPDQLPQLPHSSSKPVLAKEDEPAGASSPRRPVSDPLLKALRVSGRLLWSTARRTLILVARLIGWFAADPRRIWSAAAGLVVCAAIGAAIGIGAGLAAAQVADVVQAFAAHLAKQQGR